MKRITFSLVAVLLTIMSVSAQLDTMIISNFDFQGTTQYGSSDNIGALFNDPFDYNPNTYDTTFFPVRDWDYGVSHCILTDADADALGTQRLLTHYMGFDCTPKENNKIYAIDIWGRSQNSDMGRHNYLYVELSNGTDTWDTGDDYFYDVYNAGDDSYARLVFTNLPASFLEGTVTVRISQKEDASTWLDLYEARMVSISTIVPETGITLTNPKYGNNKAPKYGECVAENAINDAFAYNSFSPSSASPEQGWSNAVQCFLQNPSTTEYEMMSWECDYKVKAGKMITAVDVWGRAPISDGAGRTQNLHFSLVSPDGNTTWTAEAAWSGVTEDAAGYGRYVFPDAVPLSLLTDSGHFVMAKNVAMTGFYHIAELRLVTADIPNRAPIASAGDDQSVLSGTDVTLNATSTVDLDGDTLTYAWSAIEQNTIVLADVTLAQPMFIAPSQAGDYSFELVVNDGALSSKDTVVITVTVPTADETRFTQKLNIYPNPSSQGFFINMSNLEGISDVRVLSLSGSVVYQSVAPKGIFCIEADVLSPGIYFIEVINGNSQMINKVVVK